MDKLSQLNEQGRRIAHLQGSQAQLEQQIAQQRAELRNHFGTDDLAQVEALIARDRQLVADADAFIDGGVLKLEEALSRMESGNGGDAAFWDSFEQLIAQARPLVGKMRAARGNGVESSHG